VSAVVLGAGWVSSACFGVGYDPRWCGKRVDVL
jgi:hypothetical protein